MLIPTEDIVEMKAGKKVVTAKKFFPGYLLIRMSMSDGLWHVVKNTPRVTGFVGSGRKPIPLPQYEVDKIVNRLEESVEAPKPKFQFRKGESVRIIDGPFTILPARSTRSTRAAIRSRSWSRSSGATHPSSSISFKLRRFSSLSNPPANQPVEWTLNNG